MAIADQYEVLRSAALGEALPFKARGGLMLFLCRGMWGWAQALPATASPQQEQIYPSSTARPTYGEHSAIIRVLATMAMSIHNQRRAP